MDETLYDVVFKGEIDQDRNIDDVKKNIASLFKKKPDEIDHFFSGKEFVIKKKINQAGAEKYKTAVENAGAACSLRPVKKAITVVTPLIENAKIEYHVQKCPFLTSTDDGISLNRADMESIPFNTIISISVFSETSTAGDAANILFFVKDFQRPFVTLAEKIKFKEFPDIAARTVPESLKNFIQFVHDNHESLIIDSNTYEFLAGNKPIINIRNAEQYIDSIGKAIGGEGLSQITEKVL